MSELRADTITASNGTSPVTLTKQTAAKAFAVYDQGISGSALGGSTAGDTFGTSSIVDTSPGVITTSLTNNMSSTQYVVVANSHYTGTEVNKIYNRYAASSGYAAGSFITVSTYQNISVQDAYFTLAVHGDLA
tara:strand:+ start:49 stop:447 length:399 start_codon:yes stop_codon:yes gene_type:complete